MTELPIELVDLNKIKIAPPTLNPNIGDIGAIIQSIETNEWYGTIEVNRTGNETKMMIVAGNHRAIAAKQLGIKKLPVWWVDKTDDEAKAMMLGDNRASAKSSKNEPLLAELLQDLAGKGKLAGTLYDEDDLNELLEDLEKPLKLQEPVICPACGASFDLKSKELSQPLPQ